MLNTTVFFDLRKVPIQVRWLSVSLVAWPIGADPAPAKLRERESEREREREREIEREREREKKNKQTFSQRFPTLSFRSLPFFWLTKERPLKSISLTAEPTKALETR